MTYFADFDDYGDSYEVSFVTFLTPYPEYHGKNVQIHAPGTAQHFGIKITKPLPSKHCSIQSTLYYSEFSTNARSIWSFNAR